MPKPKSVKKSGWRPSTARSIRIEADVERWPALAPEEGGETLWAEVRDNLTFDELDAIPIGVDAKYTAIWKAIAPYILDWNVTGQVEGTDEWEVLPIPAEGGPGIFQKTPRSVTVWLATELKFGPTRMTPALKTDATTSGDTAGG